MRPVIFLGMLLATASVAWAAMSAQDFSRSVIVYRYRPAVFADQKLQVGLSEGSTQALASLLRYIRMDESARALFGMENLAGVIQAHHIAGLDFTGHKTLADADLEHLFTRDLWTSPATGYKFRLLKLSATALTDRALATVSHLMDLQVLELNDHMTDAGILLIGSLRQLRALSVNGTGVTDASMKTIAQFPKLQRLSLKGTSVTDAGLALLIKHELMQVDLGPHMSDQGLQAIGAMKTLEQLDLSQAHITRAGLSALDSAAAIHTLFLGPSFSDADLPALNRFTHLKRLDLSDAHVTDQTGEAVASIQTLEELALTRTAVSDRVLGTLNRLPRLRYLDVSGTAITPEGLQQASGFSSLQVLSFSSRRKLSVDDVRRLVKIPELHTLIINGVPLGRAMVEHLKRKTADHRHWLDWMVAELEAAESTDKDIQQALEVAALPRENVSRPFQGMQGLRSIHETEASLEEMIPAAKPTVNDPFEENEKNFLGELTVNSTSTKKPKAEKPQP